MARTDVAPKVSVLLQTFNHERFIERAIGSVVEQEAPFPIELIISDDCSTDSTRELVAAYARAHSDLITTVFPDENLGMNPLFQRALSRAQGQYIALLDGDDFWTSPDKLREQVEMLESKTGLSGCFHDAVIVREDESVVAERYVVAVEGKDRYGVEDLLRLCYPPTLSVMFRRAMLAVVPDWVFDYSWADWLIWIFLTRLGPFGFLEKTLGVRRLHDGGYFSSLDRSSQLEEDMRMYGRLLKELPEHEALIERCLIRRGCELAVEECPLPFDVPVILVDEPDELSPRFNGRRTTRLAPTALDRLGDECNKRVKPSRPRRRTRAAPRAGQTDSCYVVAPKAPRDLLRLVDARLEDVERDAAKVWDDAFCVIYELRPTGALGVVLEIVEVAQAAPDHRVLGRLGKPAVGSTLDPARLAFAGWAFGHDGPVAGVEVEAGGRTVWRGSVGIERPALAERYPDFLWARSAGFAGEADMRDAIGSDGRVQLTVHVVLADGARVPIGGVTGQVS